MKIDVLPVAVRSDGELEAAFETVRRQRAEAITHISPPLFSTSQSRIIAFAAKRRIPAISDNASFVREGGLMSYGAGPFYNARRAAIYIDKILNGAKPADLPVEYPTRFEMAINLRTAKELGLTLAPSVISRADQVIDP